MIHPLALALCLAVAVLAGCSSAESKNDYVDRVNEIQADVLDAANTLGPAAAGSDKDAVKAFEDAQERVDAAVTELSEIDVPAEAEAGHEDLTAAFDELSELLASVRDDVAKGQSVNPDQLAEKGTKIDQEIAKAIDEINADLGVD